MGTAVMCSAGMRSALADSSLLKFTPSAVASRAADVLCCVAAATETPQA
jgi:hypothetical protein